MTKSELIEILSQRQAHLKSEDVDLSVKALLDVNPRPDDEEIKAALAHNLCRCGTHQRILRAIRKAVEGGIPA